MAAPFGTYPSTVTYPGPFLWPGEWLPVYFTGPFDPPQPYAV